MKLEKTALSGSLAELSKLATDMNKEQLAFCLRHIMMAYSKNPLEFNMNIEGRILINANNNGEIPGSKNNKNEAKYDSWNIQSMISAGFWLATGRDLIVEIAFNNGEGYVSTAEIIEKANEMVEGSKVEADAKGTQRLINSILRTAGFECRTFYRKRTKDKARCWRLLNPSDTLNDCIMRMESKLIEDLKLWE